MASTWGSISSTVTLLQGCEHGRKLHAHHAATDHGQALRNLPELQDLVGVDGQLGAWHRDPGDGRAGGDDDVFGLNLVAADVDDALAGQAGRAPVARDSAGL